MRICSLCYRCYDDSVVSCEEDHSPLAIMREGSPEMIAGYRLDHLLEDGVKGELYRASQTACGQSCLIRVLATDEKGSQQFLGEAKLAAAFFHPNVIDVYDSGSLETGEVFVVAEDPDGGSLREHLDNVGVPTLLTSIQVVRQSAEALHAIHLKGLTHRAIGPENIILTTDGENRLLVRIKDVDLGGLIERSIVSNKFLIDSAINSLKYFAPEQCSADAATVKTDVYSLGIVLYEMLAGAPPFDGEKAVALIEKHKNQRPPDIRIDNFDLRMLLTHSLMESLQKRPEQRQASADLFARQMRHIEQLATHVSTPPPAIVVPPAESRRGIVVTAAASAIATAMSIQPLPVRSVAIEPVTIFPRQIESEPVINFKDEGEPIPAVDAKAELFDEPIVSKPHRSRLKSHKKRSHSAVPRVVEIPKNEPLGTLEPREIQPVLPVEIPPEPRVIVAARVEPAEIASVPVHSTPAKIEWAQPEDDIPSIEDVMEVLATEQMPAIPIVQARAEEIAAVPVHNTPAKIEWSQPEEDIPSIEDVMEVLATEQMLAIPIVQAAAEEIAVVPVHHLPVKIEWSQPEDDIPSAPDVPEVVATEQKPEISIVQAKPEKITIIHPPTQRMRIDRERQRPAAKQPSRNDVIFVPTILGNARKRKTIDLAPQDSIFAAYSVPSRARRSVPYRSLMIGAGLTGLVAIFLFGRDLVGRYASAERPDDPVAVEKTSAKETLPSAGATKPSTTSPSVEPSVASLSKKALKTVEKPLPQDNNAEDQPKTVPTKADPSPSVDRSQTVASKDVGKDVGKTSPFVPSKLVIYSDNGKVRSKIETEKAAADKQPPAAQKKSADTARPRVVTNPRP